jgi:hypothetical protein
MVIVAFADPRNRAWNEVAAQSSLSSKEAYTSSVAAVARCGENMYSAN